MFKLVATLVCVAMAIVILAKFYGVSPNELSPQVVRDLLVRAFYDLRDAVYALIERLQSLGSDLLHRKEGNQ